MHIHMHIVVLCLKLEEKQLVDQSLCIEKILIICLSQMKHSKVGFLCSVLFYSGSNRFVQLCVFITFLWLTIWVIVVGCGIPKGMGNIIWFPSTLLYCWLIKLLTHAKP